MQSLFGLFMILPLLQHANTAYLVLPQQITSILPSSDTTNLSVVAYRIPFNKAVKELYASTIAQYPKAQLIEVDCTASRPNFQILFTRVDVIFSIPPKGRVHSIVIQMSSEWNQWQKPVLVAKDLTPDNKYLFLNSLTMDVVEADYIMKQNMWLGRWIAVKVYWPKELEGLTTQPYYMFFTPYIPGYPEHVAVGIFDRKVYPIYGALEGMNWGGNGSLSES